MWDDCWWWIWNGPGQRVAIRYLISPPTGKPLGTAAGIFLS